MPVQKTRPLSPVRGEGKGEGVLDQGPILRVAVPSPLRREFDYWAPADALGLTPGVRVRVPFGKSTRIGVVLGQVEESRIGRERLRPVQAAVDDSPCLPPSSMRLLQWAATYYHHPIGEVVFGALPTLLRQGRPDRVPGNRCWRLTPAGKATDPAPLKRAPRQAALMSFLGQQAEPVGAKALGEAVPGWDRAVGALVRKGWVEVLETACLETRAPVSQAPVELTGAQHQALAGILGALGGYRCFLLHGVTGSGKTEVYFRAIERVVSEGRQALLLIPEIGLTPQMVQRLRRRFSFPVAVMHSGLSDRERLCAWLMARDGQAPVVIGTRSAVFVPLLRPGLIIVDEEHDLSFKQQEGFRYSARDLAVVRGRQEGVPVVLGSATPSLESLRNLELGRYHHIVLPERAGGRSHPALRPLDIRGQRLSHGFSRAMLAAVAGALGRGQQVLLFLNRRGYAPTLLCHDCGWVADCPRCDAHLIYHRGSQRLRCHHCGTERPVVEACPQCRSQELRPLGSGTERLEGVLNDSFPLARIVRVDRDSTRRKGSMEAVLTDVRAGEIDILIGTQMLAKGHHFPNVTLVGIVDADGGLFSTDFRAAERLAQLVIQVAGRAGRGDEPGEVIIQTHHPDHPLLRALIASGYERFADEALVERRLAGLAPYVFMALLRAEAPDRETPAVFLQEAREAAEPVAGEGLELLGPVPAPMERKAGRWRAQLLVQSASRSRLHGLLDAWLPRVEALKTARRVRWSLDVDPQEMA